MNPLTSGRGIERQRRGYTRPAPGWSGGCVILAGMLRSALLTALFIGLFVPASAHAGPDGYVSVRTPYTAKAGTAFPVRVNLSAYSRTSLRRTCRLTMHGPGRSRVDAGVRRTSSPRARIGWRVSLPTGAATGSWRARIACTGLGSSTDTITIEPASARAAVSGVQIVAVPRYNDGAFAWIARLRNPSLRFELSDVKVRVVFRDAAGRIVETRESVETALTAGQEGFVSGVISTAGGEAPASAQVTAVGQLRPRAMAPTQIRDLRVVLDVPYEGAETDQYVRGEALNPGRRTISATYLYLAAFDAQGRLVNAGSDFYPGDIPPSGSRAIALDLSRDGLGQIARLEVFWPAQRS